MDQYEEHDIELNSILMLSMNKVFIYISDTFNFETDSCVCSLIAAIIWYVAYIGKQR